MNALLQFVDAGKDSKQSDSIVLYTVDPSYMKSCHNSSATGPVDH